jgi:hypothetical protein
MHRVCQVAATIVMFATLTHPLHTRCASMCCSPYPEARTTKQLAHAISHRRPLPPPVVVSASRRFHHDCPCPNLLYSLMLECWHSEPNERPPMTAVVELLKKPLRTICSQGYIIARPPAPWQISTRPQQSKRTKLYAGRKATAAQISIPTPEPVAIQPKHEAEHEQGLEQQQPKHSALQAEFEQMAQQAVATAAAAAAAAAAADADAVDVSNTTSWERSGRIRGSTHFATDHSLAETLARIQSLLGNDATTIANKLASLSTLNRLLTTTGMRLKQFGR